MRCARLAFLIVSSALAPAATLRAQWQLTGDAGVARLQQTGIPTSNALTAGATLDVAGSRAWFRSSALAAVAGSDRATGQALILGSLFGDPGLRARWELAGALSGFGQSNTGPTTSADLLARARFDRSDHGLAIGAGPGMIAHGGGSNGFVRFQGDAWWAAGRESFLTTGTSLLSSEVGMSYLDAALTWRHEHDAFSVGATAGVRGGLNGADRSGGWASGEAMLWLNSRSGVVVGAGRTLDDVVRGVPRTTYASVALRFAAQPRVTAPPRREVVVAGARLSVEPLGDGRHRLVVRGVDAIQLEVMGDFTDWQPVELERDGGVWRLERTITSGLHRLAVRLDGGAWTSPVNLPHATDDLGGVVGLITIP